MTEKKKDEKKTTASKQEQEKPATGILEQPTTEEQLVELEGQLTESEKSRKELEQKNAELKKQLDELEGQLTVSNNARNELEQHLTESDKARKDLEQQLTNLQEKFDTQSELRARAEEELEQLKASQVASQEPEKPKGPPPKPKPGDCRECVHFPEDVSTDGRAAEGWVTRTKGFELRPCGSGPCEDKKFARK